MLEQCLRALERADDIRKIIEGEGLTTKTKTTGSVHAHPLLKVEGTERALFLKLAKALALEWHHGVDGQ